MKHISEWEEKRILPELQHVSKFVKEEFDRASVRRINWAMLSSQIHSVEQRQPGHVPVSRNPPEGNASARAKSNAAGFTYIREVNPNPFRQRIR
jgi:hypothetical protein